MDDSTYFWGFLGVDLYRYFLKDDWTELHQSEGHNANHWHFTNMFAILDMLLCFETRATQVIEVAKSRLSYGLLHPLKIRRGMGKMSDLVFLVRQGPNLWYTSW